jgi:hypothetical protein
MYPSDMTLSRDFIGAGGGATDGSRTMVKYAWNKYREPDPGIDFKRKGKDVL